MKLYWVNDTWKSRGAWGYSVHSKRLKRALEALGIEFATGPDDDYDLAVDVTYPKGFEKIPGRKEILFTQVESSPPEWVARYAPEIEKADLVVTSSTFSRDAMGQVFSAPIEVCPLGVDAEMFPFVERSSPAHSEPFVFLFVNSLENSKGIQLVQEAWRCWGEDGRPGNAILMIKGSGDPSGIVETDQENRVIVDTTQYSGEDMTGLYSSAHAYVSASFGDAWALTLTEAMSSGLPCIWTHWSAPLDYADESTGYPVTDFVMDPLYMFELKGHSCFDQPYLKKDDALGRGGFGARANPLAIAARMREIYYRYPEALQRGRAASERMRKQYKWEQAAARFLEICESVLAE